MFPCCRKYVQVCVQNLSELDFELSDSNLEDMGHASDLRLTPLNTQSQQVTILSSEHQKVREGDQSEWLELSRSCC